MEKEVLEEQNDNTEKEGKDFIKGKKRTRRKIHEISIENDIKYLGPLSYRHLRIFAWAFLVLAQCGTMLSLAIKIRPEWNGSLGWLSVVLSSAKNLTLPLFLIAAFSLILNGKKSYKNIIGFYAATAVGFYILAVFVYEHYAVSLFKVLSGDGDSAREIAQVMFSSFSSGGYIAFNIFIDLLLCSLFTFFINYKPTKYFQGKKIIIFRLFSLFPVIYELASISLKISVSVGNLDIMPIWVYPLLTTKPPMMFVVFLAMAFFIKFRERIFLKKGKSREEYKKFLQTKANSLHFSVFTSIIIVIAAVLDFILMMVIAVALIPSGIAAAEYDLAFSLSLATVYGWGIGNSTVMVLAIPFVMLFSYTKTHKSNVADMFIPLFGVGLMAFVIIEGGFQFVMLFLTR